MKIGVSTASYFGKMVTEDVYNELNRINVPVCETFLTTFMEYEPEFIAELLKRKGNLEVYSVHALTNNFEPQLFNVADRTRNDALKYFDKMIDGANKLGAKVYTFHGGMKLKKTSKCNLEIVGKYVEQLCNRASEKGVTLAYENVHWAYYNYPDFITELIKFAPSIHTCLDIKQAMQSGIGYEKYLEKMGDRLVNVHLCDYDSNGKLAVCGKGEVDFYELFCRLIDAGYDKTCIMEVYSNDYNSFDEIKEGYEYLLNTYERAKRFF